MELFRLFGRIAIDNTEADRAIDDTTRRASDSEKKTGSSFKAIGSAAVSAGKWIAGTGAAIGGAMLAVTESTREYRQEMGLLESAYQTSGHSSKAAKDTYSDLNAVMRDSGAAVEAAQHLALVADNEEELKDMTHTLTGVYATFGDSLPLEGLAEAINHSASLGEVQGSLADALEWSGITVDDFNAQLAECSTEEERQDLIMDTLRNTYSKAADQYKETNKDVMEAEKAQEKLSDAFAELGKVFEPIVTAIKEKIAEMVSVAAPKIQELIDKFKDCIKWVKENEKTIKTWVAVIIGATTTVGLFLVILNWGKIMTAATKAIKGVTAAVKLFNAALKANPIGLVISLLAGLVAAFIYLWNNNESFRKFWLDMWDKIKKKCGDAVDWIKTKFNKFKDMLATVKQVFGGIKDTITEKIEGAKNAVDKAIKKIKGFFPLSIGKIFSNLKIPKISVSGGKAPFGIAGKGKLPSFDVKWNAEGGIFDKPTVLPTIAGWQGFGESGAEAITPIDTLLSYVHEAVKAENEPVIYYMQKIMQILAEYLPKIAENNAEITLDGNALVGRLAPMMDQELGILASRKKRGNT